MTDEAEIRRLTEAGQRIAEYLTTTLPEDMRTTGYRFVFDTAPLPLLKPSVAETLIDLWCLHKDHDDEMDISTYLDLSHGYRVYLTPCGGIRREAEQ